MQDIYLKFEGSNELQGSSTAEGHTNEIELVSYSHRLSQPYSSVASSAGGHTIERVEHDDLLLTKLMDRSSSKLMRACSAGTVYPRATLSFNRALGGTGNTATSNNRLEYYKISLEDVVIASIVQDVSTGHEMPTETVALRYGKIVWEFRQLRPNGTSASTGPAGWDLRHNVAL